MARNCLIGLLSIVIVLGCWRVGNARDLSDCDKNGSPGKIGAGMTAKKKSAIAQALQPCTDLSGSVSAKDIPLPIAQSRKDPAKGQPPAAITSGSEHFIVLRREPKEATADTLVLMHGSGGDETTLMELASRIDPQAVLMGIRGRIVQDGVTRWYHRLTPTKFDQGDIRSEAGAFATFLREAVGAKQLDLARTTFIGYSNGANLLAAMALLHPGLVDRAVLMRPMSVLDSVPEVDLANARFLTIAGASDYIYAPFAPALEALLRERGGRVDAHTIRSGHGLGEEDVKIVSDWLATSNAVSLNQ